MKNDISLSIRYGCSKCQRLRTFVWKGELRVVNGETVIILRCEACNHIVGVRYEDEPS